MPATIEFNKEWLNLVEAQVCTIDMWAHIYVSIIPSWGLPGLFGKSNLATAVIKLTGNHFL